MSYAHITVAPDGTHHCEGGTPLYEARFDEVLKFHAPGLAPVRIGKEAWHIRLDGSPAYARRFGRTFGYYERLAAVESDGGWHHITTEGADLYADRHAWCGNFQQGRSTVRAADGTYHHIDAKGRPAYEQRWRYAGDYRDGIAVVQGKDGRSTHIDLEGRLLHGQWFLDLDVFHKGLARARDDAGWTHVDGSGRPAYRRRFAMVEPFYNGQARVETSGGSLEIIDPSGATVTVLRAAITDEFHSLSADLVGFWKTEALAAAARAGVFDALPGATEAIASRCGLTVEGSWRLLDALGEIGVVTLDHSSQWRPTRRGEYLVSTHTCTLRDAAIEYGGPLRRAWERFDEALRSDASRPDDVFRQVAADPSRRREHHRMLRSYAAHDYASLVERLPIAPGDTVFDAAGGTGWLGERLCAAFPGSRVIVGDLPGVIDGVECEGVETLGFDLLAPWPVAADVVVLARVLHDWPDEAALRILGHVRAALRGGGRLAIIELVRADEGHAGALCDLHLLAVTGGRERRRNEWLLLLERGGFHVTETIRGAAVPSLMIARPG